MNRTLFDQFLIEDQNHDFLISKAHFINAFKEKLSINDTQSYINNNDYYYSSFKSYLILKIEENAVDDIVEKRIELIYEPNLSYFIKELKTSIYKINISSLKTSIYYDLDEIIFNVKKKIKKKKIPFDLKENYMIDYFGNVRNINNDIEMQIYIELSYSIDVIWEIIKTLEDFFRIIEKNDIIN